MTRHVRRPHRVVVALLFGLACTLALTLVPAVVAPGPYARYLGFGRRLLVPTLPADCFRIASRVAPHLDPVSVDTADGAWKVQAVYEATGFGAHRGGVGLVYEDPNIDVVADEWRFGWPLYAASFIRLSGDPGRGHTVRYIDGWKVPWTTGMLAYEHKSVVLPLAPNYPAIVVNVAFFAAIWAIPGIVWRRLRRACRSRRGQCSKCGYSLSDEMRRCSECGSEALRG